MNRPAPALLKPRKSPQQARSAATIAAIHTATIQVLLADGVGRLTTTRVAARAGVSVGTMYQYYPHKQALLYAIVERQTAAVEEALLSAAARLGGCDLATIAEALATAWLDAKTADIVASQAIYGLAAEFDLGDMMQRAIRRVTAVLGDLLSQAPDARFEDVESVALMFATLLAGPTRVVMEAGAAEADLARLWRELPRACRAYLAAANGG